MEKTIMIIDDDITIRKTLGMLIKRDSLGRVLCELSSGGGAVDEILFYNPDIVLVDLLLPVLDGIGIVSDAKKQGYHGKFVMISQVDDQNLISQAYEKGILFYINKPINSIEAVNIIKNVCSNIDLENSLALIRDAVLQMNQMPASAAPPVPEDNLDDKITSVFTDIGIVGSIGSNELRKLLHKICDFRKHSALASYALSDFYDEILEENGDTTPASKKALEQRIRRTVQKALTTLAELGCNDYANSIFMEYSTLLFDFKQVRQEMRHISHPSEEPGKINTKKFIAGIVTRLS